MPTLADLEMTIPEAAFISGMSARAVIREIEEHIIDAVRTPDGRRIGGVDLVYLGAISTIRTHLGHELRRRIRAAIIEASGTGRSEAVVGHLKVTLAEIQDEVLQAVERLERIKNVEIESHSGVLAGEPVLKGTRIAARHVADLVERGEARDVIAADLDLSPVQIEAAVAFATIVPQVKRPVQGAGTPDVPAAG